MNREHPELPISSNSPKTSNSTGHKRLWGAASLALLMGVGALLYIFRPTPQDGHAQNVARDPNAAPDLALVITGQMHGYLQPCGCSSPQYGGLARRWNYLQTLKDKNWPLVLVDLGELMPASGPQVLLKYQTAMKALKVMNYSAISIGKHEFAMPLFQALSHYSLENPTPPVLAANLLNRGPGEVFEGLVKSWTTSEAGASKIKVGVVGLIGPSVVAVVKDPDAKFAKDNAQVISNTLAELRGQKTDLGVILYQGTAKEAKACANFCAQKRQADPSLPGIHVVICLTEEEEPSGIPERVGQTLVVGIGHRGRYVGLITANRQAGQGKDFDLKYQIVSIGPDFEPKKDQESANPVLGLMEEYAKEVKRGNYLAKFPRGPHPVQLAYPTARYIGSERCGDCHEHAYNVWEKSKHAHAFDTLVTARNPSLRQFDGECVACHVTGFQYKTGYYDPANPKDRHDKLLHVGCEACHGPGSAHVKNPRDIKMYPLINPYKATPEELDPKTDAVRRKVLHDRRINLMDQACQKCHDHDNDVHWTFDKWTKKNIIHMTPPPNAAANGKEN